MRPTTARRMAGGWMLFLLPCLYVSAAGDSLFGVVMGLIALAIWARNYLQAARREVREGLR